MGKFDKEIKKLIELSKTVEASMSKTLGVKPSALPSPVPKPLKEQT